MHTRRALACVTLARCAQGDGTFVNVTATAGVGDLNNARAAIFGDFDSDGDFDIYVSCRDAPNQLYVYQGNGVFEEVGGSAGVNQSAYGQGVAAADYDADGDIDLCVRSVLASLVKLTRLDVYSLDCASGTSLASRAPAALVIRIACIVTTVV